jgi:hypothetical protein
MRRALFVCAVTMLPGIAFAQSMSSSASRPTSSTGGLFSQSPTGGTQPFASGNTGSTGGNYGTTGSPSATGSGTTNTGNATTSGTTVGQGTTSAVGTASGQQILGQNDVGNNSFTGRAAPGNFIGVSATTQQANLNAFNQIFQGLARNGGGNGRGSNQAPPERFQLRPTLRVGFDHTPITATASVTSPRFEKRFAGITERRPQLTGVNIASDYEGRVVLRGTVASEDSKKLAAALLRLEPGVRDVVNEITVEPPTAAE